MWNTYSRMMHKMSWFPCYAAFDLHKNENLRLCHLLKQEFFFCPCGLHKYNNNVIAPLLLLEVTIISIPNASKRSPYYVSGKQMASFQCHLILNSYACTFTRAMLAPSNIFRMQGWFTMLNNPKEIGKSNSKYMNVETLPS